MMRKRWAMAWIIASGMGFLFCIPIDYMRIYSYACQCMTHIIDVREYPEFAGGSIPGARLTPLGTLSKVAGNWDREDKYVLVCRSGQRAGQAQRILAEMSFQNLEILAGGIEGWTAAGNTPIVQQKRPISLERQVRIAAGAMVAVSTAAGLWGHPAAFALTMFVGCGLVFAGISNICMMATVIGKMPWNRVPANLVPVKPVPGSCEQG